MTLRNNQIRQEYIEDEKNWIPIEWMPKDNPLVKLDRLTYGSMEFFRVGVLEANETSYWDGQYHNGLTRTFKKFDDHRRFYRKSRNGDAFECISKTEIIEALKEADNAGGKR